MATVILRMILDLLVNGARYQSIPGTKRLSRYFLDITVLLGILLLCLLTSDLFQKQFPKFMNCGRSIPIPRGLRSKMAVLSIEIEVGWETFIAEAMRL
jgi:hypothetical protein